MDAHYRVQIGKESIYFHDPINSLNSLREQITKIFNDRFENLFALQSDLRRCGTTLNEEFQRLSNITGDYEEILIFREQQLGPALALKRRAIAVYNASVPSIIQTMGVT